jgi:hypothetical protein
MLFVMYMAWMISMTEQPVDPTGAGQGDTARPVQPGAGTAAAIPVLPKKRYTAAARVNTPRVYAR